MIGLRRQHSRRELGEMLDATHRERNAAIVRARLEHDRAVTWLHGRADAADLDAKAAVTDEKRRFHRALAGELRDCARDLDTHPTTPEDAQ